MINLEEEIQSRAHCTLTICFEIDIFSVVQSNVLSMNNDNQVKTNNYSVFCHFGSMYSHNTFNIHSDEHPSLLELRILKWQDEPETIRIMSKDKSRQIFIPIRGIHKHILVNLKERPCVVLMLKHAVTMKRQFKNNEKGFTERYR